MGLTTDIAQVLTAAIAAALNLDIQVANNVANNAVKNNMLPMMVLLAESGGAVATAAALHYMRQVFLTAGAAGLSYLISKMPEDQRIAMTSLWNKYANSMDAAPEIDTQDKGFTPHESGPQVNATPIPERLPILHITPIPENQPIEQEGYGIYNGPQMDIFYNDLKKIAESVINLPWGTWQDYPKSAIKDREYAVIGDRLYSRHAVDRMQPSGLGAPGGAKEAGRSFPPALVEAVIQDGNTRTVEVDGVERTIHTLGTAEVITEDNGQIVITVNPFRGGKK